jgi:DNA-binding NtrC family response regulator
VKKDDAVLQFHHEVLVSEYFSVLTAKTRNEVLNILAQRGTDVVLMETSLPGADGLGLVRTIRELWPDTQIVVTTGFPSLEHAKEAFPLGAYDYLVKPVFPSEVCSAAQRATTQKKWTLRRISGRVPIPSIH